MSIGFESEQIQLQKLRERLRKMSDEESIKFGKMVRQLCGNQVSPIRSPFEFGAGGGARGVATATSWD